MELRPLGLDQIEAIRALMHRIYPAAYAHFWEDAGAWYLENKYSYEQLKREWNAERTEVAGVMDGASLEGYYKISWEDQRSVGLERLYLSPSIQGRGIGRSALDYTVRRAQALGCSLIWVEAMVASPAYEFYRRYGFRARSSSELTFPGMRPGMRTLTTMHFEVVGKEAFSTQHSVDQRH